MENKIRGRAPFIPLDIEDEVAMRRVQAGELIVNYTKGAIYLVDKQDKNKIIDITGKLTEQLEKLNKGNIEIILENGEVTTLFAILNDLNNRKINFTLTDTDEDTSYVFKDNVLDLLSVDTIDNQIQIAGFRDAPDMSIPQKRNGAIKWVPMIEVTDKDDDGSGSSGSGSSSNAQKSDTTRLDSYFLSSNSEDGWKADAVVLQPVEDTLYLKASRRQKSLFLDRDYNINLPMTVDEYVEIQYFVYINDYVPVFQFPDNIFWNDKAKTLKPNSIAFYDFKSCDNGRVWMGELKIFDNSSSDSSLNMEYLLNHFYTKEEINEMLGWQE